jgi:hypothetical protein
MCNDYSQNQNFSQIHSIYTSKALNRSNVENKLGAFYEKIFFFGTVYYILIQLRRTSFWFAILSIVSLSVQSAAGAAFMEQRGAISFCIFIWLIYLLNIKYNKADRKMQENYQDQIFWLHLNEYLIQDLFIIYERSKKSVVV